MIVIDSYILAICMYYVLYILYIIIESIISRYSATATGS